MKAIERIGTTISCLKILDTKREKNRTLFFVECTLCGNKKWMRADSIINGSTISCGCYNKNHNLLKKIGISGQKFGRLTPIQITNKRDTNNGSIIWLCHCDCGKDKLVSSNDLTRGAVTSCGCYRKELEVNRGRKLGKDSVNKNVKEGTNIKNLVAKKPKNNTSGVKGVGWDKKRNKWVAQIYFKGKNINLGRFLKKEDAIKARKKAEEELFEPILEKYRKGEN